MSATVDMEGTFQIAKPLARYMFEGTVKEVRIFFGSSDPSAEPMKTSDLSLVRVLGSEGDWNKAPIIRAKISISGLPYGLIMVGTHLPDDMMEMKYELLPESVREIADDDMGKPN